VSVAARAPRRWIPWAAAAGVLGLAFAFALFYNRPASPPRPLMRLSIELGSNAALARGSPGDNVALSPDGTRMVFVVVGADGKRRLATRLLNQSNTSLVSDSVIFGHPFFSADGQWIAFYADNKLKKISVQGGAPVTLCDIAGAGSPGGSWGDDGNIVVPRSPIDGLGLVPSGGGELKPLTKLDQEKGERTHRWPQVLPGSRAVLFTAHTSIGRYDEANIEVLSLQTGQRKTVQRGGFLGRYLPGGHLVFVRQNALFAAPFDLDRLAVTGTPVPVLDDVSTTGTAVDFDFSRTGNFVYVSGTEAQSQRPELSIFWLESSDKAQPLHARPGIYSEPRLSRNGKRLAYSISTGSGSDIWVQDVERDAPSRLSSVRGFNNAPVWSPDGKYIFFTSSNPSGPGLYWIRTDGSGEAQRLMESKAQQVSGSISPEGKRLAFVQIAVETGGDIWTVPIEIDHDRPRAGTPEPFLRTRFREYAPAFSPDGRWLAYTSNESGSDEIYVRPFPGPGGRTLVSSGGGMFPVWERNGRELFFLSSERLIMVAGYTENAGAFMAGKPRVWSRKVLYRGAWTTLLAFPTSMFDVAPDGKRIAVTLSPADMGEQRPVTHFTLLLNFFDELRRRAPAGGK
jgi:Tol biopolymer transport system component